MNEVSVELQQAQYLTFFLAGEEYAIGILQVKEIIEYGTVTRVPSTPASIQGVINVRGNVVPVVDLAVRFGLPKSPITNRTCIVIVELEMDGKICLMGIVADSVSQVIEFAPDEIVPAPAFGIPVHVDYLVGIGKTSTAFVLILNLNQLLTAHELPAATMLKGLEPEPTTAEKEVGEWQRTKEAANEKHPRPSKRFRANKKVAVDEAPRG